jgi:hypothetical protein
MWMSMGHWFNDTERKPEVFGAKPLLVPLCPPQTSYGLTWNQNCVSAVRNTGMSLKDEKYV